MPSRSGISFAFSDSPQWSVTGSCKLSLLTTQAQKTLPSSFFKFYRLCPVDLGFVNTLPCSFLYHKYRSHLSKIEDKLKLIGKDKMVTFRIKICYQVMHLWKPLMSSFLLQLVLIVCSPSSIISCFVPEITPINGYVPAKIEYIYHI